MRRSLDGFWMIGISNRPSARLCGVGFTPTSLFLSPVMKSRIAFYAIFDRTVHRSLEKYRGWYRANAKKTTGVGRMLRSGRYSPDLFGNLGERKLFQASGIAVELADAFSKFLSGHCIFIVHPAKGLFVQMQKLFFACLGV